MATWTDRRPRAYTVPHTAEVPTLLLPRELLARLYADLARHHHARSLMGRQQAPLARPLPSALARLRAECDAERVSQGRIPFGRRVDDLGNDYGHAERPSA